MEKAQADKFKKDEEQDVLLIREILQKEKSLVRASNILTQKFKQKYGPEFGGVVNIDFDIVEKVFKLNCGKDYEIEIDEDDIEDIPVRIKMFREQALEEKLHPKPKPSLIKKKDDDKQKLKTEGGGEIKVKIKNTKDAEKEMMEDDDDEDDDGEEEKPKQKQVQQKPAQKQAPTTQRDQIANTLRVKGN